MKKTFKIEGMTCNSCATRIENALEDKDVKAKVSFSKETADIEFNPEKISEKEIKSIIEKEGYSVDEGEGKEKKISNSNKIGWVILVVGLIVVIYLAYNLLSGLHLAVPEIGENKSLFLLFLVGVLTGFHCIAMCGGFVVSYTTNNAIKGHKSFSQHLVYGGAKVFSYALIGGIFGLIGGLFAFSIGLRGAVAIFAGVFMIFYSLSMLGIGFFRRFQFNPKFLTKISSKKYSGAYFGPMMTGLLSGLFIACGPLQAMYLYAAGTGSFVNGMASLVAFGLGTLPVMLGFGGLTSAISHKTTKRILKIAAVIVLILGMIMLNRGLNLVGSPISYEIIKSKFFNGDSENSTIINGVQEINMDVSASGYSPASFALKKGVPVKWNVNVKKLTGCNRELVAREYGIDENLELGMNVIEFTPDKEGTFTFTCGMGMLRGSFIVSESGIATEKQLVDASPENSGASCGMGANGGGCGGSCGGGCGCGG